jgi:hypothetical protein
VKRHSRSWSVFAIRADPTQPRPDRMETLDIVWRLALSAGACVAFELVPMPVRLCGEVDLVSDETVSVKAPSRQNHRRRCARAPSAGFNPLTLAMAVRRSDQSSGRTSGWQPRGKFDL